MKNWSTIIGVIIKKSKLNYIFLFYHYSNNLTITLLRLELQCRWRYESCNPIIQLWKLLKEFQKTSKATTIHYTLIFFEKINLSRTFEEKVSYKASRQSDTNSQRFKKWTQNVNTIFGSIVKNILAFYCRISPFFKTKKTQVAFEDVSKAEIIFIPSL